MERWIPIVDYAVLKGISTSTLRRYIKAKKIIHKVEKGRYLILADEQSNATKLTRPPISWSVDGQGVASIDARNTPSATLSVFARVRELEQQLTQAQEQIHELQMLVAIYEEKLSQIGH